MSPPPSDDATTVHVRRALDGDADSLAWVISRFLPVLRVQAAHRLGPSAARVIEPEDVVAEAWLVALRKMPVFDLGDRRAAPALITYLGRTVRFVANNALRAHMRGERRKGITADASGDHLDQIEAETTGIVSRACRLEATDRILEAIDELDEETRTIVILRGVEGLTNREIGERIGELPNTVSHRYVRALTALRGRLPGSVFEDLVDE